jgi:heme/copper-type cytochrome/quinol oxidase subunit 2
MSETENAGAANTGAPKSNGMATASLVLGIISVVLCFIWFIGIITGILAIILAVVAKKKIKQDANLGGNGAATGGLITGIIGTLISAIIVILALMFVSAVAGGASEFEEAFRQGLENSKN